MPKKYLYFQPEYVREFVCDGSTCPNNCCKRDWNIEIDGETYEKYSSLKSSSKARELTTFFSYDDAKGKFYLRQHPCPLLTEQGWCRLQLEYGEEFLSLVCKTFPRATKNFGKFFERSLSLACPVAAEMILFRDAPLSFELVEVSEKFHGGKTILVDEIHVPENLFANVIEIQIAMISILQERTLSIDQRLIVLGFFVDRLDEIISSGLNVDALTKLIAAYESKSFLARQVPQMSASVHFDAKKFSRRMLDVLNNLRGEEFSVARELLDLTAERKLFTARHATLMENFLVNELFMTCFPWMSQASFAKNFGLFVATYKVFELLTCAAAKQNLDDKANLLRLVDLLTSQTNHTAAIKNNLLNCFTDADDIFSLMETFLEGRFESDGTAFQR